MTSVRAIIIAVGVVILAGMRGPIARGQATPSFRAETRLVVLYATVTNGRGELVTNLDRQAFTVFENGKPQPITLFRRDDVPVSLGLLIDNSGSMRTLRARIEAAALVFARACNPLDEMFVLDFADTPRLDVPMTSDVRILESGIHRVDSIGGTALRDAIQMGESYLIEHAQRSRRVLLVITDGNDNASVATVEQVRAQAERAETVIDAIGLFSDTNHADAAAGRHELTELTTRTGGVAYFPSGIDQIDAVTLELAHQIRTQYTIAYAPLNQALDGSYRAIRLKVSAEGGGYSVRTRAGYRALSGAR